MKTIRYCLEFKFTSPGLVNDWIRVGGYRNTVQEANERITFSRRECGQHDKIYRIIMQTITEQVVSSHSK